MVFDQPLYLLLFVIVPVAVYFVYFRKSGGGRLVFPIVDWPSERFKSGQHFIFMISFVVDLLFWAGLSLLIIAIAGPSEVEKVKVFPEKGLDIMIVLDQSPSMAIEDVKVGNASNRFETSKKIISDFIRSRENDAIGIVSFGSSSYVRVSPTVDYDTLISEIDKMKLLEAGKGSAIGMGLASACRHLQAGLSDRKIIILITDGNNVGGEIQPETAAEIASSLGIKIYSIGIGTNSIESFSYKDGNMIVEAVQNAMFNEKLLSKLANRTGGRFLPVTNAGFFEEAFDLIDSVETIRQQAVIKSITSYKHRQFLILAMVFIFGSYFFRKVILLEVF
jgi:Ca-activated chloride channel family protein